jgi:hypothetical protein
MCLVRRKLETEVRMLHEQLEQVNAVKHDLEQNVKRCVCTGVRACTHKHTLAVRRQR